MKFQSSPFFLFSLVALAHLLLAETASAQLNDKRFTRDATGAYKGKIKGGTVTYLPNAGEPVSFPGPTNTGRVKVPVSKGKSSVGIKDDEVGGDGRAKAKGRAKDPKVKRGGKSIKYTTKGSVDNPSVGFTLYAGKLRGTFKDTGSKWKAIFKGGGIQTLEMDEAYVYKGRNLTGVH